MNDDFGFSKWAVLFPVLSLTAFVVATIMIFTTPAEAAASANERRILYTMVAFLGLSALIQGNALFQVERRLKTLRPSAPVDEESVDEESEEQTAWDSNEPLSDEDTEPGESAEEVLEADSGDSEDSEVPKSEKT